MIPGSSCVCVCSNDLDRCTGRNERPQWLGKGPRSRDSGRVFGANDVPGMKRVDESYTCAGRTLIS